VVPTSALAKNSAALMVFWKRETVSANLTALPPSLHLAPLAQSAALAALFLATSVPLAAVLVSQTLVPLVASVDSESLLKFAVVL